MAKFKTADYKIKDYDLTKLNINQVTKKWIKEHFDISQIPRSDVITVPASVIMDVDAFAELFNKVNSKSVLTKRALLLSIVEKFYDRYEYPLDSVADAFYDEDVDVEMECEYADYGDCTTFRINALCIVPESDDQIISQLQSRIKNQITNAKKKQKKLAAATSKEQKEYEQWLRLNKKFGGAQ